MAERLVDLSESRTVAGLTSEPRRDDFRAVDGGGLALGLSERRLTGLTGVWLTVWTAGWFWIGLDTLQTPEDPFPPAQSCGVWKVHGTIVIGPDPEQS